MPRITLRHLNNMLTLLLIFLALYIVVLPFVPALSFWVKKQSDTTGGYVYQSKLNPNPKAAVQPAPKTNRIVIPSLLLDEPIHEGKFISTLNNGGTWHRPKTSTPDEGGNTVVIGHRYTYKGQSTFYNLDKLKQGDVVILYWGDKEYDYKVTETKVVAPTTAEIEKHTEDPILTLYTCTPLWSAKNRLVVIAKPLGVNQ